MERDDWQIEPRSNSGRPGLPRPVWSPDLGRRAKGLTWLAVQGTLGLVVVVGLLVVFGFLLAVGWEPAGWLIGLTLLFALLGLARTVMRGSRLLSSGPAAAPVTPPAQEKATPLALPADTGAVEATLLQTLRTHERPLSVPARAAFHATVIATRDAVRATAGDAEMNRDAFDARQAAREDLPELMSAYRAVRKSEQTEAQLLEQLQLIHARMSRINAERAAVKQDKLAAHGHYLREKYQGEADE